MKLPMFPLGSVLFPGGLLPLHIFEARYRELTRACLAGDREFGVVLIERGSEVGGADVRHSIGTVAQIIEATELEDGRWLLAAVGTRRIRVDAWLDERPYPLAEVSDWHDERAGEGATARYAAVVAALRRVLALKSELGDAVTDSTIELSDDPGLGSFHVAAVGPWGPADQYGLLSIAGTDARIARLDALLAGEESFARARMEMN
ncbi:MAG: LON peptidase substrate-binding domain-containing protein [Acidimicrobiales bacterium]